MKSDHILAIDQSITCTAWCVLEEGQLSHFGCIKTKPKDGSLYTRVRIILNALWKVYDGMHIHTLCCREGLAFGNSNSNASRDLAYLVGAIEANVTRECLEVPPSTLKTFATGYGKADKQQMIDALPEEVRQQFLEAGFKKTTGLADLADAYFIGKYFYNKEK